MSSDFALTGPRRFPQWFESSGIPPHTERRESPGANYTLRGKVSAVLPSPRQGSSSAGAVPSEAAVSKAENKPVFKMQNKGWDFVCKGAGWPYGSTRRMVFTADTADSLFKQIIFYGRREGSMKLVLEAHPGKELLLANYVKANSLNPEQDEDSKKICGISLAGKELTKMGPILLRECAFEGKLTREELKKTGWILSKEPACKETSARIVEELVKKGGWGELFFMSNYEASLTEIYDSMVWGSSGPYLGLQDLGYCRGVSY